MTEEERRIKAALQSVHGIATAELERGIISDMKVAILSKDDVLIDLVGSRLRNILEEGAK